MVLRIGMQKQLTVENERISKYLRISNKPIENNTWNRHSDFLVNSNSHDSSAYLN